MKITGIISEYNPFHNGHLYHIKRTRENGATHIIAVMSGNYVQRGDAAVMDKFRRAQLAIRNGADLVIEIPTVYALASAEFYARGAVYLLHSLGCTDELSFGSEVGSVEEIERAAEIAWECEQSPELEELLRSGMSYPNAINSMIHLKYGRKYGNRIGDILSSPNNVLAVEYLKAIRYFGSDIKPFTIHRKSAAHDSMTVLDNIASASFIRKCIEEGSDFYGLVPDPVYEAYQQSSAAGCTARLKNLERILIYRLRTITAEELREIPDVGQGLENRFLDCAPLGSIEEIMQNVKTKRYTMARIKRILFNMLIGIKKDDLKILPPYIRILAVNERGRDILSKARETAKIPFGTSLAKLARSGEEARRFAEIEGRASDIYALAQDKIGRGQSDYKAMISLEKDETEDISDDTSPDESGSINSDCENGDEV
ncbi:MAG: nucleotidyltransferase [Porcipelethomonas sp.]